ncbi:MAG: DUF1345 domain-containing protein [Rhodoblastus sp.]
MIAARPRLFLALAFGALAGWLAPDALHSATRTLIGWNVACVGDVLLVLLTMRGFDHRRIRHQAQIMDDGRYFILVLCVIASLVAIWAIIVEMSAAKGMAGWSGALHLMLAGSTIVSSWLFMHMIFTLHYAHEYYLERQLVGADDGGMGSARNPLDLDGDGDVDDIDLCLAAEIAADPRGGLIFPGTAQPNYIDFAYFSYTIGVASQTSDVAVSSRAMRGIVLVHSVFAFFFNTTILALTINLAAGLF